mgnify:CR=1 FL=1
MIEIRKNLDLRKSFLNQDYTVKIKIADYIYSFFFSLSSFFVVDGSGAGYGNLEIIVNGGRVSCHVAKSDSDEKFTANFIPHDAGRHRLDVKFNGDKVPGSPWFCEVRNH